MSLMSSDETLQMKLEALSMEHRRLNDEVDRLSAGGLTPSIELMRLKKRRLALRDSIQALRDRLTPDIIA